MKRIHAAGLLLALTPALAEQIGIKFPLLSDMNHNTLASYGILKTYPVQGEGYPWALRANIVIDKTGVIRHIETGDGVVNPNNVVAICTDLHKRGATEQTGSVSRDALRAKC